MKRWATHVSRGNSRRAFAGNRMLLLLLLLPLLPLACFHVNGAPCAMLRSARASAHLGADGGERDGGRGLLVHEGTEARLGLDDAIGDVHLTADSGQPQHELRTTGMARSVNGWRETGWYTTGKPVAGGQPPTTTTPPLGSSQAVREGGHGGGVPRPGRRRARCRRAAPSCPRTAW